MTFLKVVASYCGLFMLSCYVAIYNIYYVAIYNIYIIYIIYSYVTRKHSNISYEHLMNLNLEGKSGSVK